MINVFGSRGNHWFNGPDCLKYDISLSLFSGLGTRLFWFTVGQKPAKIYYNPIVTTHGIPLP